MIRAATLLLVLVGLATACGRKSDPVPPVPSEGQAPASEPADGDDTDDDITALEATHEDRAT